MIVGNLLGLRLLITIKKIGGKCEGSTTDEHVRVVLSQ